LQRHFEEKMEKKKAVAFLEKSFFLWKFCVIFFWKTSCSVFMPVELRKTLKLYMQWFGWTGEKINKKAKNGQKTKNQKGKAHQFNW